MVLALMLSAMAVSGVTTAKAAETRVEAMLRRESDWTIGPIVYQVFVDRFAPSDRLDAKNGLYPSPRRLRAWSEKPVPGSKTDLGVYSHEIDFWGGDLAGVNARLDYLSKLADVVYLNPIFKALTNHKYDATDYFQVDPQYGSLEDFKKLAASLHRRKMRLVLDGVFNHCGKGNAIFQKALADPRSPYREWFTFDKALPNGYKAWANVPNLPEIRLETKAARDYLWNRSDSVVATWLKRGADGWRLDVAHEIGFEYLAELTRAAHRFKPGSVVISEAWNYPAKWTQATDGILGMFTGRLIQEFAQGNLSGRQMGQVVKELVQDCGIEPLLRSWIVLANHDTERLATALPDPKVRRLAQAMQFVMPGAPLIYYGEEIGMRGGGDPRQRAPMEWDKVTGANEDLAWTRKLVALRRSTRALRIGDARPLVGEKLFGMLRTTEKPLEATIVVANPTEEPVTETLAVPEPTLMGWTLLRDGLSDASLRVSAGLIRPTVPPKTAMVLTIDPEPRQRTQYKRMKDGD